MPINSLHSLLRMFPYFFDKSETSNFYKSQKITNNLVKTIYQDVTDTYESFHLNKKLLVWKEQTIPYEYVIRFVANIPLLKTVEIYCDDEVIYDAEYTLSSDKSYSYLSNERSHKYIYSAEVNPDDPEDTITYVTHEVYPKTHSILEDIQVFNYSHSSSSQTIIPTEKYLIKVTTYDEYTYSKGFPENSTILNNEYDHDISLDEIGEENNIPRRQYTVIDEDDYSEQEIISRYQKTDPPFNNQSCEDDYHYMKRILSYLIRYHTTSLPVLEIWKLYGVESSLINRDKFILRLFDENIHPPNSEGGFDWIPEPWEHKDFFVEEENIFGEYFYASANTVQPVKKQDIMLYFEWKNSLAEILTNPLYSVDIFLNGILIEEDFRGTQYPIKWQLLNDDVEGNLFIFHGKKDGVTVKTVSFTVRVRGCGDADFYVNPDKDNETEDGSYHNPYHNLEDAINNVNGVYNLIAVFGTVELNEISLVKENCTIIGCNNARIINNIDSFDFFKIAQDVTVTLQDITLVTPENTVTLDNDIWINNNRLNLTETVVTPSVDYGVLLSDLPADTFMKNLKLEGSKIVYTEISNEDLQKLEDTDSLIQNLRLNGNTLMYDEYSSISTGHDKELPYIHLDDRLELITAVEKLELNNNILLSTEYGDEIAWQPLSHLI